MRFEDLGFFCLITFNPRQDLEVEFVSKCFCDGRFVFVSRGCQMISEIKCVWLFFKFHIIFNVLLVIGWIRWCFLVLFWIPQTLSSDHRL